MIVQCERCESKFNLDPAFLKPTGTVVRCSICKNVFVVHPEPKVEEAPPETLFEEEKKEGPSLEALFEEEPKKGEQGPQPEEFKKLEEEDTFKELFGEAEKEEEKGPEQEEVERPQEAQAAPAQKKGRGLVWLMISGLAALLIATLIFVAYNLSGKALPILDGFFKKAEKVKKEESEPGTKKLSLSGVSGKFVTSEKGSLFVISGNIRNRYSEARKDILVKANLLDNKGNVLREETAYAGIMLSDQELSKGDMQTIRDKLNRKGSFQMESASVEPGKTVQFLIVFADIPENVSEFTVQTLESKPAK